MPSCKNLIDLAIAAAFIQKQDYYGQAGWKMDVLRRRAASTPIETYEAPEDRRNRLHRDLEGQPPDDARRRRRAASSR